MITDSSHLPIITPERETAIIDLFARLRWSAESLQDRDGNTKAFSVDRRIGSSDIPRSALVAVAKQMNLYFVQQEFTVFFYSKELPDPIRRCPACGGETPESEFRQKGDELVCAECARTIDNDEEEEV